MNKRKRKRYRQLFLLLAIMAVFTGLMRITEEFKAPSGTSSYIQDSFSGVKKYAPELEQELKKFNLESYTPVLIALMQQESKGMGNDPMQSSESAGLAPGKISTPRESIIQGVRHFNRIVSLGRKKGVDFPTIIQAYNMGSGYISYVSENGGRHSEELAKRFSGLQVKKDPDLYNCRGDKNNFRYPYCYGDFTYSSKVFKNLDLIAQDFPFDKKIIQ
ncbi:lysozyme family protein [Peribacillus sp. SCS-37]|uniref:lysozyme family protein n=1 Tax=Paraperibacillus esterisolvens TaxID=3115296 RepID=UPI003905A75C